MTDKGFENNCLKFIHTVGFPPEENHMCVYAKSGNELRVIFSNGSDHLIRLDGGTGVDATQRVVERIEENGQDSLYVFFVDKTYTDGILTTISEVGSYEIRVDT